MIALLEREQEEINEETMEDSGGVNLDALNWAMNRKRWIPAELNRQSGVSKSTLTLLFNGTRPNLSSANLAKIARALDVSSDFLLGDTGDPARTRDIDTLTGRYLDVIRRLPETRRQQLLSFSEYLLSLSEDAMVETQSEDEILERETERWLLLIERARGIEVRKELENIIRRQ